MRETGGYFDKQRNAITRAERNTKIAKSAMFGVNTPLMGIHVELLSEGRIGTSLALGVAQAGATLAGIRYKSTQEQRIVTAKQEVITDLEIVLLTYGDELDEGTRIQAERTINVFRADLPYDQRFSHPEIESRDVIFPETPEDKNES